MATILVIEDEPALLKVLDYNFKQAGHDVLLAPRGAEGVRLAREHHPDVVLLDQMLPDVQGTEVCRSLQMDPVTRDVPIVFVTARGDEVDRIVAFELGAVDYVVKPFSVRELILRVQAILRRTRAPIPSKRVIEFGILRIDDDAHRVWVDDEEVGLTLLEFRLLVALYENRARVQTRSALLENVWGMDVGVTTRTVDAHVKRLRDKIGIAGSYVQTVRGLGYRFAHSPDEIPPQPE
jgi:two-component system phosphate regulon response regulator PhoB